MSIPNHFVFVWIGSTLPPFARRAIGSVLRHNPGARVSLLHGDPFECTGLASEPRVRLRRIDIDLLLERAAAVTPVGAAAPLDVACLRRAWAALESPAARSNLVRLLVLYAEGGVYLDTDTLTLRSFAPLLDKSAFCGVEHILWPRGKLRINSLHFWLRGPALTGLRFVLGAVPHGYRAHRWLLPWYERAVNNAVLGFEPAHPALRRALCRITELAPREWTRRFRLGTHLLQEVLEEQAADPQSSQVEQLSPEHFYPVAPVISKHYFKRYAAAEAVTRELLDERTYLVHFYGSVSNLLPLGERYVRDHADTVVFAHLSRRALEAV
jgi:Glycosyltransferase sugar-binding region containing DXD motif